MPLPKNVEQYAVMGVKFEGYKLPYQVYLRENLSLTEEVLYEILSNENRLVTTELNDSILTNVYIRWLSEQFPITAYKSKPVVR